MTGKIIEALFRHKLLLLVPPLLVVGIVTPIALLTAPVSYETWAGVWVDRPTYLNYNDDWNRYISPAQNQSARLTEVLHTRSFLSDVARRTALAPLSNTATGEERIATFISNGLTVTTSGQHLLVLRFRAETPQLAYQTLNAIVDAFNDYTANDQVNQAGLATSFYEARLQSAEEDLAKAADALRNYVASNPLLNDPGRNPMAPQPAGAAADPQLAQLQDDYKARQTTVDQLRSSLDQAQFDAGAAVQGQELGFQVVDPPRMPAAGGRDLKKRIVFPLAAAAGGLALSAILLVILVASDRSVRGDADLPNVRVLGALPMMRPRRLRAPKGLKADVTRRAIGYVAGTALPAPGGAK